MLNPVKWWRRRRLHLDGIDNELASHLALEIRERLAAGESRTEAEHNARRALGNHAHIAEATRESWGFTWAEQWVQDLRYALRQIARTPALFGAAILLVALGVAANTAVFSFADAILLRELPVRNPDTLVQLFTIQPRLPAIWYQRYGLLEKVRRESKTIRNVIGQIEITAPVHHGQITDRARLLAVTSNYFQELGLRPQLGHLLTSADSEAVVLSHTYWLRAFGADKSVVGKRIEIWKRPFTIAGVAAPGFGGTVVDSDADLWLPHQKARNLRGMDNGLKLEDSVIGIIARLRPGVTVAQATAELEVLRLAELDAASIPEEAKAFDRRGTLEARSIAHGTSPLRDQASKALWVLLGGAAILALMVASNIGGLLLARAGTREKEIALRLAIGASQGRIARMWAMESAVVALAGGLLGALIAAVVVPLLAGWLPPARGLDFNPSEFRTRSLILQLDWRIAVFAVLLCGLIAFLATLAPALRSAKSGYWTALKAAPGDTRQRRFQSLLCAAQVGLCTLLLVFGAWMLRSLSTLRAQDTGLRPGSLAILTIDPDSAGYLPESAQLLKRRVLDEVSSMPGVESVALADRALMRGIGLGSFAVFPDRPPEGLLNTSMNSVSPGYFETMGIPLIAGRLFEGGQATGEVRSRPYPVVVNREFARKFFPGQNTLGKVFATNGRKWTAPEYQIIGIVADTKYRSLREVPPPIYYAPDRTSDDIATSFVLHIRTLTDPAGMLPAIRRRIAAIDPRLPIYGEATFAEEIDRSLWLERLLAGLSSGFAVFALLLTTVGLYGLVAFFVAARRREIGIRMAIGAQPADVASLVLHQLRTPVLSGIALGLGLAWLASRYAATLYYGIQPTDPISLSATALFISAAIALSAALPTVRAIRIDPASALKQEG